MAFLHWEKAPVLRLSVLYCECLGPTVSLSWDFARAMGWCGDVLIFVIRYPGPKSSYETHLCFMYTLNTLRVAFYTCVFSRHEFLLRYHMRSGCGIFYHNVPGVPSVRFSDWGYSTCTMLQQLIPACKGL